LKLIGRAIARKKGEEREFLAMLHGAKVAAKQLGPVTPQSLEDEFAAMGQKGFPVEDV